MVVVGFDDVVSNPFANDEVMDGNRCDVSEVQTVDEVDGMDAICSDKSLILFWIASAMQLWSLSQVFQTQCTHITFPDMGCITYIERYHQVKCCMDSFSFTLLLIK